MVRLKILSDISFNKLTSLRSGSCSLITDLRFHKLRNDRSTFTSRPVLLSCLFDIFEYLVVHVLLLMLRADHVVHRFVAVASVVIVEQPTTKTTLVRRPVGYGLSDQGSSLGLVPGAIGELLFVVLAAGNDTSPHIN